MKIQSNAMDRIRQLNTRTLRETVGLQEIIKLPGRVSEPLDGQGSGAVIPGNAGTGLNYGVITTTPAQGQAAWEKSKALNIARNATAGNGGAGKPPTGGSPSGNGSGKIPSDKSGIGVAAGTAAAAGAIAIGASQLSKDDKKDDNPPAAPTKPDTQKVLADYEAKKAARKAKKAEERKAILANVKGKDTSAAPAAAAPATPASAQPDPDWMKPALDAAKNKDDELDNKRKNNDAVVAQAAAAAKSRDDNYAAAQQKNSETIANRAAAKAKPEPTPAASMQRMNLSVPNAAGPAAEPAAAKPAPPAPQPVAAKPAPPAPQPVAAKPAPPAPQPVAAKPAPPAPQPVAAKPAPPAPQPVAAKPAPPAPQPVAAKPAPPAPQPVAAKPPPDNISPENDISPEAKAAGEKRGVNAEKLRAFVAAANKNKVPTGPTESVQSRARSASFVFERIRNITEGRPSQRHPLEGHDYHKKSNDELVYIAKDAHKAAEAMKGHNTKAENKYRDQANDSATVRYYRQKSGMPDWYKKKYGHLKEESVPVPPIPKDPPSKTDKSGIVTQKKLQTGGSAGGSRYPWNYESVQLPEAKEKTEYDYEGDMARGQLQSIISNAQRVHDMLEDNDNLAEWVQSKITLAEDYISTVANYMMSEVDEEVQQGVAEEVELQEEKQQHTHVTTQDLNFSGHGATHTVKKGSHMRYVEGSSRMYIHLKNGKPVEKTHPILAIHHKFLKTINEEVQLDELNKDTLYSYSKKAEVDQDKQFTTIGKGMRDNEPKSANKAGHKFSMRSVGMNRADKRLQKEEQIEELSSDLLGRYKKSAGAQASAADKSGNYAKGNKRFSGIMKATKKQFANDTKQGVAEEVESIDEAGPGLWANIHAKRQRIKQGSKERMRNPGEKGAPESGALEKARGTNEEVKGEYERKVDKYLKKKYTPDDNKAPPFDAPYAKMPKADKSGAIHSPMSRAKHLAKMAGRKQAGIKENSHDGQDNINTPAKRSLSKTAGMVKTILKGAKSKNKNLDKFENEPELSSQIVKQE